MKKKEGIEAKGEGSLKGEVKEDVSEEVSKAEEGSLHTLKDEIEAKGKEFSDLQDKYLRLYAEFENFKKVVSREQAELLRYGHERFITEVLPVMDNLERAIVHSKGFTDKIDPEGKEALNGLLSGVEMTLKQMMDVLGRFGVRGINALGEPFDPTMHHAVSQLESKGYEPNTVIEELRKGYLLNDRVIRPSMVVVSRKVEKEEPEDVEASSGDEGDVVNIETKKED